MPVGRVQNEGLPSEPGKKIDRADSKRYQDMKKKAAEQYEAKLQELASTTYQGSGITAQKLEEALSLAKRGETQKALATNPALQMALRKVYEGRTHEQRERVPAATIIDPTSPEVQKVAESLGYRKTGAFAAKTPVFGQRQQAKGG